MVAKLPKAASEVASSTSRGNLHLRNAVIIPQKRAVLMIEIHSENGHIAERYEAVADIDYQHYDCRAAESEPTVFVIFKNSALTDPFSFLFSFLYLIFYLLIAFFYYGEAFQTGYITLSTGISNSPTLFKYGVRTLS